MMWWIDVLGKRWNWSECNVSIWFLRNRIIMTTCYLSATHSFGIFHEQYAIFQIKAHRISASSYNFCAHTHTYISRGITQLSQLNRNQFAWELKQNTHKFEYKFIRNIERVRFSKRIIVLCIKFSCHYPSIWCDSMSHQAYHI